MTNILKKVTTAAVLSAILLIGTSTSFAGIVVAGFTDSAKQQNTCTEPSTKKGILIPDFGIVVAGITGIVVAGITGIVVAGVSETQTNCGIVVAG